MECNGPQCSTSQSSGSQECDSCNDCECPGCTGQDVLKFTEIMWHKAAMAAMLEAKKDRIKSRLEKQFGLALDKGADAVVEAIGKKISFAVQGSNSEQELNNNLYSIIKESLN